MRFKLLFALLGIGFIYIIIFLNNINKVTAQYVNQNTDTDIGILRLDIVGLGIRHGTPDNINLGTISYSDQNQEVTGTFDDYFWVEDLMGSISGHYTTIQCNGLRGPNGANITGIYFKVGNSVPDLMIGMTGDVSVSSGLNNYQSIYNPLVYIYKTTNADNVGIINKYGDIPSIKVVIPANTQAGTYNGTITFSLYMD